MTHKKDSEDCRCGCLKQSDLIVQIIVGVVIVLICISIIYLASIVFKHFHKGDPLYMTRVEQESSLQVSILYRSMIINQAP